MHVSITCFKELFVPPHSYIVFIESCSLIIQIELSILML